MNKIENLQLEPIKNLFKLSKLITFLLSTLFLYWGLYSNLVLPIINVINDPTAGNVIITLLRILVLSGICLGLGLTFTIMTFFRINIHNHDIL
jgi:hypothetical protein